MLLMNLVPKLLLRTTEYGSNIILETVIWEFIAWAMQLEVNLKETL